jgi:hypothetical protein
MDSLLVRASNPDDNNEGVDILVPGTTDYATPPLAACPGSNEGIDLCSTVCLTKGTDRQEEPTHIEEVVHARSPISQARRTPTTENVEYDSDLPLQAVMNLNRNAPLTESGSTNVIRAKRSTPTPPSRVTRPPMHRGPPRTVNNEVHRSAQQPTQLSLISGPRESSLGVREHRRGGKKRLRKTQDRLQRNTKRPHPVTQRFIMDEANSTLNPWRRTTGERHPVANIDGTTDTLRLTKRLVQTRGVGGVDTEVRNLNSEVEHELLHLAIPPREDDGDDESPGGNASEEETNEETNPEADEVSSDETFAL